MSAIRAGYKQTEVGVIPSDWEVKPVGAVASYTNGKAHEGCIYDLGKFIVVNSKFISTGGDVKKYSDMQLSPASVGEILMVMSDVPNGRAIARCFLVDQDNRYTVNQRICILKPLRAHPKFLFYKLNRNPYYLAFDDGVKQTNLRKDDVLTCTLPIPPSLVEQEAIAGALSDTDALIESLEQLLAKKHDLKQGAMQELLTGNKRLPGFSAPWKETRLGDVAEIVMGQSPSSSNYNVDGLGLPLIQGNADIVNRKTITRVFTTEVPKLGKCGDILMSVRAPVGEISRAVFDVCLGRGVCAIRHANDFLYHYLINQEPSWAKHSKGSTFDSVNSADLKHFGIRLPDDVLEQDAIAAILTEMDTEIAELEAELAKTRALTQGMMQKLLTGEIRLI